MANILDTLIKGEKHESDVEAKKETRDGKYT